MIELTTMRAKKDTTIHKIGEYIVYGPGYSTHSAKIINTYIPNKAGGSIMISYYENGGRSGSELYFYNNWNWGDHFYRSRHYKNCQGMPAKYAEVVETLKRKHAEIFG